MAIEIFKRREQKYLVTMEQYRKLMDQMDPYMRPDEFGTDGHYTVTSLYFESPDNKIYFETKNKLNFRQKLRLRVYDDTDIHGTAFFEVKQKHNKVVNKRRMLLPLAEAYRYLDNNSNIPLEDYETSNQQVLHEINHFREVYNLDAEMVVSYDRHALFGVYEPELRVTFDFNLRCRNHDLLVEHGPYGNNFIDQNSVVMEVKVNDSVPLWLTRILQFLQCEQKSVSKYCTSMELLSGDQIPNAVQTEKLLVGGGV